MSNPRSAAFLGCFSLLTSLRFAAPLDLCIGVSMETAERHWARPDGADNGPALSGPAGHTQVLICRGHSTDTKRLLCLLLPWLYSTQTDYITQ